MQKVLKAYLDEIEPFDLFNQTLFSPPPVVDPTVDYSNLELPQIIKEISADELWRVGTSFLKRKAFLEAERYLKVAQQKNRANSKIVALRGFVQIILEDYEKAASYLQKALTKSADLEEARLWLAYVRLKQGKSKGATLHLAKLDENASKKIQAIKEILIFQLKLMSLSLEELTNALESLRPFEENHFIKDLFVVSAFLQGRTELEKGALVNAARIWSQSFNECPENWFKHHFIADYFNALRKKKLSFIDAHKGEDCYKEILEALLHFRLLPEFFEEKDALNSQMLEWKQKAGGKGNYPYANFRYSICLLYQGLYEQAYQSLLDCRDKIPASKVSFFSIDDLIDWVRSNKLEKGRKIEEREERFSQTEDLESWLANGFSNLVVARRWQSLGAMPLEAREWINEFSDDPSLAYSFYAVGFRDAKTAKKWSLHFFVPIEAWECYSAGVTLDSL